MCRPDQLTTGNIIIWKNIYQRYHTIHVKRTKFTSHIWVAYLVGVEVSKVCFSLWYLVLSTLFASTYHPCIRSSFLHINFTSWAIIYIPHFKRELYKHHVGLRDPESTSLRKKYLLSSTSSELTYNFSATKYIVGYYQEMQKKIIYNVF